MKVLIVGAGAVGLVYGYHLQQGGAEVSFYVKEKYLEQVREGFRLHPLNSGRKSVHLTDVGAFTTPEEVAKETWDQVWLCISATAFRGPWLDPFLASIGDATLVAMQPGLDDRPFLAERIDDARIVQGMISMVSYQCPLPDEQREEGVAYWFPPLSPSPFTGSLAESVVKALKAGGCPVKVHANAPLEAARGSAILMPHLVALEAAGWSLSAVRRGEGLDLAAAGSREALAVVAACTDTKPPCASSFVRPGVMRLLLAISPWAVPFPLETYLRYHFTKVGDQTRFMIQTYVEEGKAKDLPTEDLEKLQALLV